MENIETKDYNLLIDRKSFFNIRLTNKEKTLRRDIVEMNRNKDYSMSNILYYEYFSKHYRIISIRFEQATDIFRHYGAKN